MKKILVVDDDQVVCNMLKKFLNSRGYEAIVALSGVEAIKKVKEEKPHVVLLDIRMSGIDGIETLKEIRRFDRKVAIFMITAVEEEETGRKCIELGAYDYFTKPLSLNYLENALSRMF